MLMHPDLIVGIHPDIRIRRDGLRFVCHPVMAAAKGIPFFVAFLAPRDAAFLYQFNGKRSFKEIIACWSFVRNISIETAIKEASAILERISTLPILILRREPPFWIPGEEFGAEEFFCSPDILPLPFAERCAIPVCFVHVLTYKCSARCMYCYAPVSRSDNGGISVERIRELARESGNLRIGDVTISGGDPFLHPDIFPILESYASAGLEIHISTKSFLPDKDLGKLKDIPGLFFQISVDTMNANESGTLNGFLNTGFPSFLEKIMSVKLHFSLNTVVTPYNVYAIPRMVRFVYGKCPDLIRKWVFSLYGRSRFRHRDSLFVSREQYNWLSEKINVFIKETGISTMFLDSFDPRPYKDSDAPNEKYRKFLQRPSCSGNRSSFVLLPDGKVTLCEELYDHPKFIIGDLTNHSILEAWNSEKAISLFTIASDQLSCESECFGCSDFERCHRVLGKCFKRAILAYGDAHWDFPDPFCPRAPSHRPINAFEYGMANL